MRTADLYILYSTTEFLIRFLHSLRSCKLKFFNSDALAESLCRVCHRNSVLNNTAAFCVREQKNKTRMLMTKVVWTYFGAFSINNECIFAKCVRVCACVSTGNSYLDIW